MRKIYKLTKQDNTTHNGFKFTPGKWTPELDGSKGMCSDTCYHSYASRLLAVLLNPIHAGINDPILWEGGADGFFVTDGLKQGDGRQRLVRQTPLPEITTTQKAAFAILCSLEVNQSEKYRQWAEKWLSGGDRTARAARAARVGWAPSGAARAARAAEEAASWAAARVVRVAEAEAVRVAEWAAAAAVWAAAEADENIDFNAIALKATEYN